MYSVFLVAILLVVTKCLFYFSMDIFSFVHVLNYREISSSFVVVKTL